MTNDINQRAKEWLEYLSKPKSCKESFIAGITEERERGKRFNYWTHIFGYEYSMDLEEFRNDNDYEKRWTYEQLFDKFISEEK